MEKIIAKVVREVSGSNYGKFLVQPLNKGYGTTLGNALRRVLLTSIPGAAFSSIKIDGVLHEFASIPGVKEDVFEIILNLKEVNFRIVSEDPTYRLDLHFKGKGIITARDLVKDTNELEVLNPDKYICTMNEKADMNMELTYRSGVSWIPAEKNKRPDSPIGTIFMDSIFSPITKVNFKVENLPGTSRGEVLERLTLEIFTDGSITAEDALDYASKVLQQYFAIFSKVQSTPVKIQRDNADEETVRVRKLLQKSVDEMELSVRSYNCLKANNIKSIAQLVQLTEADMLKFKNFGRKSLTELTEKLKSMNLDFGIEVNKYLTEDE
ncbi:MAG: DNA-directed RNA polymerase subunit alpha [Candidatus Marinimicrobia bacterium]|nr:DNA-directed RNA polymerase subunit alpha [Candidatus Neomarinimicrobiota bacterium]